MSDGTPLLRVAADRIGAPGSPAGMPFRATNAANWSSIIRIGAKLAVIRRRIARRAVSNHTQRAGRVPYGESRLNEVDASSRRHRNVPRWWCDQPPEGDEFRLTDEQAINIAEDLDEEIDRYNLKA